MLPDACAAGARIVTGRVRAAHPGRTRPAGRSAGGGVVVRRPDGSELEILSPLVVVAAGALQSPPLLRRSGLGGHPRLGRNLAVHPATSVAGRFAEPVTAWEGVLQSVGVEELHGDGILIEATAGPPGMGSLRPARASAAHCAASWTPPTSLATLGAMIADRPRAGSWARGRTLLRYDLDPATRAG